MTSATLPAEYSTLAAIAVFLLMFGGGARWAWSEFRKANEADRLWREGQEAKRAAHEDKQASSWQATIDKIDQRREAGEKDRQETIQRLAEAVSGVSVDLRSHNDQAKEILTVAQRIDRNTMPGNGGETPKRRFP